MENFDSLRFDLVDHVLLIVHADVVPSDADWARLIAVRNASRERIRGTLVIAPPRANINTEQRTDVTRFTKETGTSIAVVTDSALIRGVARALGFLVGKVKAFAPSELSSALQFLAVPASRQAEFLRRIELMKTQLAGNQRKPGAY